LILGLSLISYYTIHFLTFQFRVLFTTTLVVFIIHMRKHGHAAANAHTTINTTPNKLEMQPQVAPQYPPQQQYAQPQYAAQPQYGAPGQQQYGAPGQPIATQ
jgi:hypothetical protein